MGDGEELKLVEEKAQGEKGVGGLDPPPKGQKLEQLVYVVVPKRPFGGPYHSRAFGDF